MSCLWDTDTVSEYLKGKNPHVMRRAGAYFARHGRASISLITRYEILRGLKAKQAAVQLTVFEQFCQRHHVLSLEVAAIDIAADVWAGLSQSGQMIGDNDILIAATALHHGLTLATANVAHFSRIPKLTLEDWTQP